MTDILERAKNITQVNRPKEYGHPMINFLRMAIRWTIKVQKIVKDAEKRGVPPIITPADVAWMMVDSKVAREEETHKQDNADDIVGYLVCRERIANYMESILGYDDAEEALSQMTLGEMSQMLEKIVWNDL